MRRRFALVFVLALLLAGCFDDPPNAGRFCARLAEDRDLVVSGAGAGSDTALVVERYRELGEVAPLEIRDAWRTVTDLVAAAAVLEPSDAEARRRLAEQAFAAQPAAVEVATWARDRCGVDLGPVASLPAVDLPPTSTTAG